MGIDRTFNTSDRLYIVSEVRKRISDNFVRYPLFVMFQNYYELVIQSQMLFLHLVCFLLAVYLHGVAQHFVQKRAQVRDLYFLLRYVKGLLGTIDPKLKGCFPEGYQCHHLERRCEW